MSALAVAVFGAYLKRARHPVSMEVLASESDEFRRAATESGWLFREEPREPGWVRISCERAPAEVPS